MLNLLLLMQINIYYLPQVAQLDELQVEQEEPPDDGTEPTSSVLVEEWP